jgi:hypothetical protein
LCVFPTSMANNINFNNLSYTFIKILEGKKKPTEQNPAGALK